MIKVYFESKNHSELFATFEQEEDYIELLPYIGEIADSRGLSVTESVEG